MNWIWTYNWLQFVFIGMLSIIASIVNYILRSIAAVWIGILFTTFFLLIGSMMLILNRIFKPSIQ